MHASISKHYFTREERLGPDHLVQKKEECRVRSAYSWAQSFHLHASRNCRGRLTGFPSYRSTRTEWGFRNKVSSVHVHLPVLNKKNCIAFVSYCALPDQKQNEMYTIVRIWWGVKRAMALARRWRSSQSTSTINIVQLVCRKEKNNPTQHKPKQARQESKQEAQDCKVPAQLLLVVALVFAA